MNNIEQKLGFDRIRQMVAEQCTNALATRMADEVVCLPIHHELSEENVQRVIDVIISR